MFTPTSGHCERRAAGWLFPYGPKTLVAPPIIPPHVLHSTSCEALRCHAGDRVIVFVPLGNPAGKRHLLQIFFSFLRAAAPPILQGLITDLKNDLDLLAPVQKAWKAIILQTMLHEILAVSYKSAAPLTLDCDMFFEITSPVPHP